MAHAQYHKNQRVYVRPVGTWALVEKVIPHWTKGIKEPLRISYDVGLGRDFSEDELQAEILPPDDADDTWRIVRGINKVQSPRETEHHPHPGTYPVVVTGEAEWGGWRVPAAEYTLSPERIEGQARLIACAPRMAEIVKMLLEWSKNAPGGIPNSLADLAGRSEKILRYIDDKAA